MLGVALLLNRGLSWRRLEMMWLLGGQVWLCTESSPRVGGMEMVLQRSPGVLSFLGTRLTLLSGLEGQQGLRFRGISGVVVVLMFSCVADVTWYVLKMNTRPSPVNAVCA